MIVRPTPAAADGQLQFSSPATGFAAAQIAAAPCNLYNLLCSSEQTADRYLQAFDQVGAPGAGAVPVWSALIPLEGQNVGLQIVFPVPCFFGVGLYVAVSANQQTYQALGVTEVNHNLWMQYSL